MAKSRKTSAAAELPPIPRVGDKVIPERSESIWVITHVSPSGEEVNLNLERTNLERFRVRADTLKFVDRKPPVRTSNPFTNAEPVFDAAQVLERVRNVQGENLQRLDDDIAILTKYLKAKGASKSILERLETLSNEQHASWQAAIERIEELMEEE
jgi:hypothetical protein